MISISNLSEYSFDKDSLKKAIETVLRGEACRGRYSLSLAFISPSEMKRLNRKYYKKERLSDVLSFQGEIESFPKISSVVNLGEVVICPARVATNARLKNNSFEKELIWVLIHGLLHLIGYDHEAGGEKEKKMRQRENFYLKKLGWGKIDLGN
jgi:rRNA maturation RNase YbeY